MKKTKTICIPTKEIKKPPRKDPHINDDGITPAHCPTAEPLGPVDDSGHLEQTSITSPQKNESALQTHRL